MTVSRFDRPVVKLASLALALLLTTGLATAAGAAKKSKSTQTEAKWVSYDAATKQVVMKIQRPGTGPNKKMMKKNKEVTFRVVPEGSVLKRTTVTINAQRAEMTDVEAGKRVNVYWVPDPENEGGFFARKIDVVLSEEELNRRFEDAN